MVIDIHNLVSLDSVSDFCDIPDTTDCFHTTTIVGFTNKHELQVIDASHATKTCKNDAENTWSQEGGRS